jgi:hypothetical protein
MFENKGNLCKAGSDDDFSRIQQKSVAFGKQIKGGHNGIVCLRVLRLNNLNYK